MWMFVAMAAKGVEDAFLDRGRHRVRWLLLEKPDRGSKLLDIASAGGADGQMQAKLQPLSEAEIALQIITRHFRHLSAAQHRLVSEALVAWPVEPAA
jgi:hypothetical protein